MFALRRTLGGDGPSRIELQAAPAKDLEQVDGPGAAPWFTSTGYEPQFAVHGFPSDLPLGMYRLSIETPNAADILDESIVLATFDALPEPVAIRMTFERHDDRIDGFFVLPPNCDSIRFAPHFYASRIQVGGLHLSRFSTTARRLRRVRNTMRQWSKSPAVLGRQLAFLGSVYRTEGWPGLGRERIEAFSPTRILSVDTTTQVGPFAGKVATRNREALAQLAEEPPVSAASSLSIIVPIYRTPEAWLAELLASIDRQTDQDFEVVLVFDGTQDDLEAFARNCVRGSYRLKVETLAQNAGVSAASNRGIRAASGEHVVVVDHDDVLEKHFVAAFRLASARRPADISFADEAITDGRMHNIRSVATRGAFDIRYYLSHPYIVHPIFLRRDLVLRAGLFDEALNVSHDVDLVLRCLALAENVVQIPLLLYFWRTHERSLGHQGIKEVATNTKAAISRYLDQATDWTTFEVRDGINFNEYDIRPPLPDGARAAIVIPTKNRVGILSTCLASLYATKKRNLVESDIYVVDHQSDDPQTIAYLAAEEAAGRITVVPYRGPWNFAAINNAAVAAVLNDRPYSHLVFMNNDIEIVTDDWLDRMIAQFAYPDVGVVGCCLQYPNGQVQHAGVVIGLVGVAEHAHKFEQVANERSGRRLPSHLCSLVATRDYNAVTAALMIVPVEVFQRVEGFDERLAVGFNDTDLCLRIGALGLHSTYVGSVVATHYESLSRGEAPHLDDTALFRARYGDLIEAGDVYWGAMLDRSSAAAKVTTKPQKAFRLVETHLHRGR